MSSLFYRRWKQYFQMPIAESVESLGLSAYRYYGFLCREMNVYSAVELHYSNAEIAQATGIKDHKTHAKARSELVTARLIQCRSVPPGVYAHIMLDQSGSSIPAPEGRRGIRHYESHKATVRPPAEHQSNDQPIVALTEPNLPLIPAQNKIITCRTHGAVSHWQRGEDWICESCHPNPHSPERWHQPTAREIGFM